MKKEEFFEQLEYLLQDIPNSDKEEALAYYRDYLEEAGSGREEQVIAEFGSPERVAAIIRADITGNLKDGGSFTENGYEDERFRDPNYQVAKRLDLPDEREGTQDTYESHTREEYAYSDSEHGRAQKEGAGSGSGYDRTVYEQPVYEQREKKPRTSRLLKGVLWVVLILAASPFLLGAAAVSFGAAAGIVSILFGIVLVILCLTAAAFIISVGLAGFGLAFLVSTPLDSIFLFGVAAVGVGCGLIGIVLLYAIFGVFCPSVWKGIKKLMKLLSGKRKEAGRA